MDLSLVYVPKSISEFLKEVSKIKNGFQRLSKISDYVKRLEDEMKKVDAKAGAEEHWTPASRRKCREGRCRSIFSAIKFPLLFSSLDS